MVNSSIHGLSIKQASHRKRLQDLQAEVIALSGNANKIAQAINQILSEGGKLGVAPQIAFLTGAIARIHKDFGVIEYLQATQGVEQNKCPPLPTGRK